MEKRIDDLFADVVSRSKIIDARDKEKHVIETKLEDVTKKFEALTTKCDSLEQVNTVLVREKESWRRQTEYLATGHTDEAVIQLGLKMGMLEHETQGYRIELQDFKEKSEEEMEAKDQALADKEKELAAANRKIT